MCQTAANLVDKVIPDVPIRQWVVTLPMALRFAVAYNADLLSKTIRIVVQEISRFYRSKAKLAGIESPQTGAVVFVQRAGGQINLNPHLHIAFIEGVFSHSQGQQSDARFQRLIAPKDEDVLWVLEQVAWKITATLQRAGMLNDESASIDLCTDHQHQEADTLALIQQSSLQGKLTLGTREGQTVRKIGARQILNLAAPIFSGPRCASRYGFSIHADTFVDAGAIEEREQLLRYMSRPPISHRRLSLDEDGSILWKLKNVFSDGTHTLKFSALELIEKIASIIPPPWKNLVKYFGVLAPNAKIRKHIVPSAANQQKDQPVTKNSSYIPWAELLKRTFKIDITECHCGGRLQFMSAIFNKQAIGKITSCLGFSTGPPKSAIGRSQAYEYEPFYE